MGKGIFITATDTNVGKTVATFVLATLLKKQGYKVGIMKPVQCGGLDAQFFKKSFKLKEPLSVINPLFAPEPLSPHLAFARAKIKFDLNKVKKIYEALKRRYDIVLIEGAGGLLVPIKENYLVADLIRDLDADAIVVSRLGLGTINHTLLTLSQARARGINLLGVLFSEGSARKGIPEKTNPQAIKQFGDVEILGTIVHLKEFTEKEVLKKCRGLKVNKIFGEKKSSTRALVSDDKKYIWHPFTQMKDWLSEEPLVIEEAKGCYLKDTDGKWYLDGISSLWVNVHGHRHPEIDRAVKAQLDKLGHSTLLGLTNPPAIELAKKLVEITPKNLTKVFYSDNGSTSVEVALKMAYQYWQNTGNTQKHKIVHLQNSYHGDTLGSVSVGGIELFHKVYKDLIFETIAIEAPFDENLSEVFEQRGNEIAAVIIEPLIQGAAGMLLWPKGSLKRVEKLCRAHGAFLIADEVATGFGRTGKMFACEHEAVRPDFLCLAKGLTGGYLPLAATLTTERVFKGFLFNYKDQKSFFHGHTYTGNPLACAAALANLKIFEKEKTLYNLQPKIWFLAAALKRFTKLPHVGEVRQKGFMVGIELLRDKRSKIPYSWEEKAGIKVCQQARKEGLILRPLGNIIVLMPPLAISIGELEKLVKITYKVIKEVTAKL